MTGYDRDLELFRKAEQAAKAGNAHLAEAIAKLETLNFRLEALDRDRAELVERYAALERSIIEQAADL